MWSSYSRCMPPVAANGVGANGTTLITRGGAEATWPRVGIGRNADAKIAHMSRRNGTTMTIPSIAAVSSLPQQSV
jgi:hypothetical protein